MYATGIATVRSVGLDVEEADGWRTRGRGPLDGVRTLVVHHTASAKGSDFPSRRVLVEGRSDLPGPLCNLAVTRSGTWVLVAAGRANHAGAVLDPTFGNPWSLGIEVENDGQGEPWSTELLASLALGLAALAEHYDIPSSRVLGHREVCSPHGRKIDPSTSMTSLRSAVADARIDIKESPLMALSDTDAKKIAAAIVDEMLGRDTIPDRRAVAAGATAGTAEATVSLRTVLAAVYEAARP